MLCVVKDVRKKCKIFSFDVKALYPSVKKHVAVEGVKYLVTKSAIELKNVDYKEIAKYLSVMMTREEVVNEKLDEVIPKRVKKSRRPLTTNCLMSNKPENEEWVMGRTPTELEKRKKIANVLGIGVKVVMGNHTYMMGDTMYLQSEGCPIGLDLSQAVARAVMMMYDEKYLAEVKNEGIQIHMYCRYVDDSNQIVGAIICRKFDDSHR